MRELRRGASNRRADLYPGFSTEELDRRWDRLHEMMADEDLDALVVHGDSNFHQPFVRYLTDYEPPFLTYLVIFADENEPATLFIGLSNHLQYVRETACVEDVRLSVHGPGEKVADRLAGAVGDEDRVGLVGVDPRYGAGMPYQHYQSLDSRLDSEFVDATASMTRLVSVRSDAELKRVRRAGEALDDAMQSLADGAEAGMSEAELRGLLSSGASHDGGGTGVVFLSTASMADAEPGEPLPWKASPAQRSVSDGDVITTEVSAHHDGYATQIHRPFAVGSAPTETYRDIFDVASDAYENLLDAVVPGNDAADVHDALAPIEESPFKSYDVCVHGYGGGYLHPFIGTERSNYWPNPDDDLTADWTFEPGQVVVVQPNVVTEDERAGLQFGTTLILTEDGNENVHEFPAEFGGV